MPRHPRLIEQYSYRARATARFSETEGSLIDQKRDHFTVVLAAVAAGRTELLRLHRAGSARAVTSARHNGGALSEMVTHHLATLRNFGFRTHWRDV
jgi:hypothetical protein